MNDPPFNLREIALPAFGPSFLFALGEGAILPVIALTVRQLGGSVALAALMVTLIGIGSLVSNIPASLITARWGERWALVGAALWGALGMALCVLAPRLWLFAIGVFMVGMSAAVFGLARQSYLTEVVPFHFRARALSTLGGVMRIGLFVGPFLAAAVIHAVGIAGAYWAGVGSLVVSAIIAGRIPDLPTRTAVAAASGSAAAPARATFRSVGSGHARIFLTVGIGALLVSAVRASRQAVIPLWAEGIGLDAATTSLIYGFAGGVDMLVFYPAGKVMDRKGRAWVAVPSMLIMAVALMLTPLTHGCGVAAARFARDRLRQRHRLGNDHDARRGLLAGRRPRPLPRPLAAHVGHRLDGRAGAALGDHGAGVARDRHLVHRGDRLRSGLGALVLDPAHRAAPGALSVQRFASSLFAHAS